jgi:hypothetical protein
MKGYFKVSCSPIRGIPKLVCSIDDLGWYEGNPNCLAMPTKPLLLPIREPLENKS